MRALLLQSRTNEGVTERSVHERRTAAYPAMARRRTNYQAAVAERVAKEDGRADTKPTDDREDLQEDSARA